MDHYKTRALRALFPGAAAALLLAAGTGSAGASTIHVQVDATGFRLANGYLDMQFSATSGVPLATALVGNLSGFGPAAYIDQWGVTATDGAYLFRNDTPNDFFHAVSFSAPLSFDLTFDGAADPLARYLSRFTVSAFDENGKLLGTHDPDTGALATFSWTPARMEGSAGTVTMTIADPNAITAVPLAAAVPEPGTCLLLYAGCAAAFVGRRRARGAKAPSGTPA